MSGLGGGHQLLFLQDPQRLFGGIEWIHALGRESLDLKSPEMTGFLTRVHRLDQEMSDLLLQVNRSVVYPLCWIMNPPSTRSIDPVMKAA